MGAHRPIIQRTTEFISAIPESRFHGTGSRDLVWPQLAVYFMLTIILCSSAGAGLTPGGMILPA
jgi:hypothetical protein